VLAVLAVACPGGARADTSDHLPPRPFAQLAAAAADTGSRVFVSLISGRDEAGRDLNLMSVNLTNYGFVGNNFTTRTPSMEYPVGTGHEHLVRGGLWIGALAADANGAFIGVTTGAVDGFTGDAAASATEFSPEGDHIETPRLVTGAAVAVVASENSTVQEADPTSALASSNKALISGQVDVSRQLLDFSRPGIDEVLALDLGNDTGLKVDQQLISGTNANGQTLGLANVASINTVTYTSGTPTAAALISKIWSAYQAIADAGGGPAEPGPDNYLVVVAPRRAAALGADQGQTSATPVLPSLPGRLVVTPGIRQNLGAGTNEDEVYVIARSEVFVCLGRPVFAVYPEVGSSTATVRLQARQYCAAMFARQPKAIARISGTGLTPPSL